MISERNGLISGATVRDVGEINRETAIKAAQQAHRNYAKRQMTWFRREPEVSWLKGFGDEEATVRRAGELVAAQLQ